MHLKIMWMNLASTNKDPEVVVKYYLDVVESIGGFVSAVIDETLDVSTYCRLSKNTTCGTENCHSATAQIAFRTDGCDDLAGDKSFGYGKSTINKVMECIRSKELVKLLYFCKAYRGTLISFVDTLLTDG